MNALWTKSCQWLSRKMMHFNQMGFYFLFFGKEFQNKQFSGIALVCIQHHSVLYHLNHTPLGHSIWPTVFHLIQGLSCLFLCAFEHHVWFLSENVLPGCELADNGCLYSIYCMCAWFGHWLFVAFCSTVRRGWQVFKLDISFNVERWCRVIRSQHNTQTHTYKHTLSQSICLTTSTGHYWREKKRMRKSIGQWPPWNSCSSAVIRRFHMCTAAVLDWEEVERNRRKHKEGCWRKSQKARGIR